MTETQMRQRSGVRKKPFAVPPVKIACLSCRSSRIRCDGQEPCSGCLHRGKDCIYVQSRRGGARVPRSKKQEYEKEDYVKIVQECFDESVPTMIKPGAGLTQLDLGLDSTENIFSAAPVPQDIEPKINIPRQAGSVRIYQSDDDILAAYYIWIHPFFPILPPSEKASPKDNPQLWFPKSSDLAFEPYSPTSLAISAILALIPHPDEGAPFDEESIKIRREAAHSFAKRALERIENDSEMPDSDVAPAKALVHGHSPIQRAGLHPRVAIELEGVLALSILSVYEYAQRGNMTKMRDRASQALMTAMNLSLHDRGVELDVFAEARRRAWWMAYICVCQASIVSSAPPAIPLFDVRFTTSYPQASDPEAWPFFIQSQQTILLATQFVSAVGRAVEGKEDWQDISRRMLELHSTIEPLLVRTDHWTDIRPLDNDAEAMVAYSLRQISKIKLNSARIKIHRYCAFSDIPVFSEKHCDLQKSTPPDNGFGDPIDQASLDNSPACGCNQPLPTHTPSLATSISPPTSTSTSTPGDFIHPFPFTSHASSALCLTSALSIAEAFEALPLPQAANTGGQLALLPRTMPSFACCAMQSSYALLMVYHRTWVAGQQDQLAAQLLQSCESGLRDILAALANYSVAFEALGGMRDQIQAALDCLSLPDE